MKFILALGILGIITGFNLISADQYIPQALSCKIFQDSMDTNRKYCEYDGILMNQVCRYQCNNEGDMSLIECSRIFKRNHDFPMCSDLYCSDPSNADDRHTVLLHNTAQGMIGAVKSYMPNI